MFNPAFDSYGDCEKHRLIELSASDEKKTHDRSAQEPLNSDAD